MLGICLNTAMKKPVDVTTTEPRVGDTVQVRRSGDSTVTGTVIEDFADYMLAGDAMGRDWAVPHRWAVATTEGTLIFVDDSDIIERSPGQSTP